MLVTYAAVHMTPLMLMAGALVVEIGGVAIRHPWHVNSGCRPLMNAAEACAFLGGYGGRGGRHEWTVLLVEELLLYNDCGLSVRLSNHMGEKKRGSGKVDRCPVSFTTLWLRRRRYLLCYIFLYPAPAGAFNGRGRRASDHEDTIH